jgi:flagellar basal-body rod protein FlgG
VLSQLFQSKTALEAFQTRMQVIANNVSNAQTVGYKRREAHLESLFPVIMASVLNEGEDGPVGPDGKKRKYLEYGQGVRVSDIAKDVSQGTIEVTNQPLDIAVEGQGFFQFRLPDGRIAYGRAGNLHMDQLGNVVNPNGQPLEPAMQIPQGSTDIIINEQGRLFVQIQNNPVPQEIGQIVLAVFNNPQGLREIGQNLYIETAASGSPVLESPTLNGAGTVRQRALEFSNVNIIEELFDMLVVQRSFEVISRAIQVGNDMIKAGTDIVG